MKSKLVILMVALLTLMGILACGGSDVADEVQSPDAVAELSEAEVDVPAEEVVQDVEEAEPTAEPPEPTNTPEPEPTPPPPPDPVLFEGFGDTIVDVEKTDDPMIARISGNDCSGHFAVKNYDENNETLDLLVNITDPYQGVVPIDFFEGEWTKRFEITSSCEWIISLEPIVSARFLTIPGSISGTGDDIVVLDVPDGKIPDLVQITGNEISHHFAVKSFGGWGDLLVNTTDPYDGTSILDPETAVFVVTASDDWTIEVTAK